MLREGEDQAGDLRDDSTGRHQWANLPPKEREKILQSRSEGFPEEFDDVLTDYFRRVAEESLDVEPSTEERQPD